ncbi:hypothetical protein [Streptomyces sp. NPDC097610]|uniref:hypothetical protein n=1 Tax=Streptomyces sp. NPDC097610 TaxID=3157227 RepID=UPI003325B528
MLPPALPNIEFPISVNAVSEAFNSVLKVEYVHRHTFATRTDFRSPIDYEHSYQASLTEELAA